jgi:putative ABC transport system permease protein
MKFMRDAVYLAWRYLVYHRGTTLALCAALTTVTFVPLAIQLLVSDATKVLHNRAESTPMVLGRQGSSLELTLHTLYFESPVSETLVYSDVLDVNETPYARAIPLIVAYRARKAPVVGTTVDYLAFRDLQVARGRRFRTLGECVLGLEVARRLKLDVGDTILSTPDNVFNFGGSYALKMKIVGVLERSSQADDRVVFCDIKTAWVIAGLGHGHEDAEAIDEEKLLGKEGNTITASRAVAEFNEISEANMADFHFHGSVDDFPLTAAIVLPNDNRAETILLGRYDDEPDLTLARPNRVINNLLATVARLRTYALTISILLGTTTLLLIGALFALIWKLRAKELRTMRLIGASRGLIATILGTEAAIVFAASALLASAAAYFVGQFGETVIWWWV